MRIHRSLSAPVAALPLLAMLLVACVERSVEDRLTEIQQMLRESRYEEAIAELRSILDTSPDHPHANFLLAAAFRRTSQPTLAVWPLEKAFADPDFQVRAGIQLGSLHLSLGNPTDAIRVAERLLEVEPQNAEAHRILARAYLADKRFEEALEETEWLVEADPSRPIGFVLKGSVLSEMERYDEAEAAFRESVAMTEETPADNERAWLVLANFLANRVDDPERAEEAFRQARGVHPESASIRTAYLEHLVSEERYEDAEKVLRDAIELEPENLQLRISLAGNLREQGRDDEADQVLEQMTEDFPLAASWEVLGRARLDAEDYERARAAFEKAVTYAPDEERLRFLLAEAVVRSGDFEEARRLAGEFEREPYRHFVEGLIALEREEHENALERFESGLRHWPDNAGARYNAGVAARALGDWDRATEEFTEAARTEMVAARNSDEPFQTDAAMQLARIELRRGRPASAIHWARVQARHSDDDAEAALLMARALRQSGQIAQARAALQRLLDTAYGSEARAELAELEYEQGNEERADALVEAAEPGDISVLSVAVSHDVESGEAEAAIERLDGAAASGEYDEVGLRALRGRALHMAGRSQKAEETLRAVLERDPEHAPSLAALGTVLATQGKVEEAIGLLERAAELQPGEASHHYYAGQLLLAAGRTEEAEDHLRAAAQIDPGHAEARNDLAWLLAQHPERLDEAYELASDAYALNDASAFADTLGWIHYLRGEYPMAVDLLSRAAQQAPGDPIVRYHLGMALARHGESSRALEELRAAVQTGGFSEVENARLEIARLEDVDS